MLHITFHFNVAAATPYVCKLLRQACAAGHRAWVLWPTDQLAELDRALWAFSKHDFISHVVAAPGADSAMRRSAVVLSDAIPPDDVCGCTLLVNGQMDLPPDYPRFARVVELVGNDAQQKAAARERWRQYRDAGQTLHQFDAAARRA